ncbi:MAG: phenylacetate--CoA ligase family protein [Candidatus Thermoplasmatota archaeon]|nr:phenylacetate--CoA ligase family protein [Candidatus Thermoplasmatota archaeon]
MHKLWEYLFNEDTGRGTVLTTLFYHSSFQKTYDSVKRSEQWSTEEIARYQWQQLTRLLHHAYHHVPYYKKLLTASQLTPGDITSLQDFQRIPLLSKETVQAHEEELKATNYPPSAFEQTNTGGSTGLSLRFYIEKGAWFAKHLAYLTILLERANCHALDTSVQLIGREKPWEYRAFSRTLVLSSYQMTEENLPRYVEKIRRLRPAYFIGYPSAITMLAGYMKQHSMDLKGLKAIFCFGETIYDWQREFLESYYRCRVHSQYGQREQCVFAGTCETSNAYHLFPDYGFAELLDRDGQPVTKEGESGEIVATGFHTGIFPFIRYKTGDIATYTSHECECGRHSMLFPSVEGRVQDFMVSRTNRLVPLMGVLQLISRSSANMMEYQLYQDTEGELVLYIVKKPGFSDDDVRSINTHLRTRLGDEFSVSIAYTDAIPRTARGKYKFFVQKLPVKYIS